MPRGWAVDLTDASAADSLPKPPGYSEVHAHEQDTQLTKKVDYTQLKLKKARELAWSPAKSFFMTGIMLWMSGNGVHIFSIMITFYAIYNPVKSAFTVNTGAARSFSRLFTPLCEQNMGASAAFARFVDPKMSPIDRTSILMSKLTFVMCNLFAMSGALYKM